jgi:hypothetical protein
MDLTTTTIVVAIILMIVLFALAPVVGRSQAQKRWEEKNRKANEDAMRRDQEWKYAHGKVIVEVKMLGGGSTAYKHRGVGGAVVGGLIGGVPGAIVGAALPSTDGTQKQKFAVKYSDGKVVIKELHPNSWEYKELMKYVKWEDIK